MVCLNTWSIKSGSNLSSYVLDVVLHGILLRFWVVLTIEHY